MPVVQQETVKELHGAGRVPEDVSTVVRSKITYVYGLGLISATDQNNNQRYYFPDALGSTAITVKGSNGTSQGEFKYDAFGALRFGDPSSETMLFTGQQFDNKALGPNAGGLYNLRARYYDPEIGRFLTRDPLAGFATQPQTMNPYPYVVNSPVNFTDPTGLHCRPWHPHHCPHEVVDVIQYAGSQEINQLVLRYDFIVNVYSNPTTTPQELLGFAIANLSFGHVVHKEGIAYWQRCWGFCTAMQVVLGHSNQAIGHNVFLRADATCRRVAHESTHVHQSNAHGFTWIFDYIWELIEDGYIGNSFEVEAQAQADLQC